MNRTSITLRRPVKCVAHVDFVDPPKGRRSPQTPQSLDNTACCPHNSQAPSGWIRFAESQKARRRNNRTKQVHFNLETDRPPMDRIPESRGKYQSETRPIRVKRCRRIELKTAIFGEKNCSILRKASRMGRRLGGSAGKKISRNDARPHSRRYSRPIDLRERLEDREIRRRNPEAWADGGAAAWAGTTPVLGGLRAKTRSVPDAWRPRGSFPPTLAA
jgi:hypothetical protein